MLPALTPVAASTQVKKGTGKEEVGGSACREALQWVPTGLVKMCSSECGESLILARIMGNFGVRGIAIMFYAYE
jgi:hypothetical protein